MMSLIYNTAKVLAGTGNYKNALRNLLVAAHLGIVTKYHLRPSFDLKYRTLKSVNQTIHLPQNYDWNISWKSMLERENYDILLLGYNILMLTDNLYFFLRRYLNLVIQYIFESSSDCSFI